ncbi:TraR/DksA C4-type zinc finger protein [Cohnella fermenti]|uniref:Molecular chaperone DnaK n=1 Tax=Cohnella fermenti TaxID=2565925 RepID=A0A4S4BHE9_9BACL|nr:TraR/DksA C4-type zinc finger protein [Cohnella fermenti]THF73836.1 molecular chaperone DnaK [Cohnella fermenti]
MTFNRTDDRLDSLRRRLLQDKEETERLIHEGSRFGLSDSYKDATGDLSGIDNHPADAATETFERGKDIALLESASLRLERIEAALGRMDTGEYGRCVACGRFIPEERLEALPTAIYCIDHEPMQHLSERRPVEETLLKPPFGQTSLDELEGWNGFDGEDTWQIVESWGSSNSPAMAEDNDIDNYGSMAIESDENDGFVEPIESFLATDITGHDVGIVRNRAYKRYLADQEGEPLLEDSELSDDWL